MPTIPTLPLQTNFRKELSSPKRPLRTLIVGGGKHFWDDIRPALEKTSSLFRVVGVCDRNPDALDSMKERLKANGSRNLAKVIDATQPDVAIVSVPHNAYLPIISELADRRISIIKNKPLATSVKEAQRITEIVSSSRITLEVIVQRRFDPGYQSYYGAVPEIGNIREISAVYSRNWSQFASGWRGSKKAAGGGVLIDAGYHFVDLIVRFLGLPTGVFCVTHINPKKDVEDSVFVLFRYAGGPHGSHHIIGSLKVSGSDHFREEHITVQGDKDVLRLPSNTPSTHNEASGKSYGVSDPTPPLVRQFRHCHQTISANERTDLSSHIDNMAFIAACYESEANGQEVDPRSMLQRDSVSQNGDPISIPRQEVLV